MPRDLSAKATKKNGKFIRCRICKQHNATADLPVFICAVINGLRSYYQQKYPINKDEYESEIKAMEEAEIMKD